jgi:hypothetical protein
MFQNMRFLFLNVVCLVLANINIKILKFTRRARASRVTEVSKEGGNYKQNGEPIGTPADRLVVTSLDSGDVVMRWCGDSVMWSWCDVVIW